MSVDSSLEPQFGSISEDLLEQFVLEDDWYFSDEEEESSDSEDSVATEEEESLLPSEVLVYFGHTNFYYHNYYIYNLYRVPGLTSVPYHRSSVLKLQ